MENKDTGWPRGLPLALRLRLSEAARWDANGSNVSLCVCRPPPDGP